jgi:putative colanic acid biosynthesis acetyltransferase WcaF
LCTASHNISSLHHEQIQAPIIIGDRTWVAARAYIGPGVTVGEGAVVGATASVYKDVEPWTVVGGNPAKFLKKRVIREQESKGNGV